MDLNVFDLKLFSNIAKLKTNQLNEALYQFLKKKYEKVVRNDKFVIAEGNIPIVLVSHMDTVFSTTPQEIFCDKEQNVLWSPEGLGADDRAGIYIILKIIQYGLRPSIVFTDGEEMGCLGALELVHNYPDCPFKDIRYIIELDRRGENDCVFYDCANSKFEKYIESFGFKTNVGSFSDISVIGEDWGIAAVNLSVGYLREHTYNETLYINALLHTLRRVVNMLNEEINSIPFFDFIPSPSAFGKFDWFNKPVENEKSIPCSKCGKAFNEVELVPVVKDDGKKKYFCADCCVDNVEWCIKCNSPYEPLKNKKTKICPKCYYKNRKKNGTR